MLIIKQSGCNQEIYQLKKDEHIQIDMEGEYVIFHYFDKLEYKYSKGLSLDDNQPTHLIFHKRDSYFSFDIYLCFFDQNYNVFNKYAVSKKEITVGNGIDNDIYIQDNNLLPVHLKIDLVNKCFINENVPYCYNDNKAKYLNENIKDLNLLNLRIYLHDDFIMINRCMNIYVHLPVFNEISKPLKIKKTVKYINKSFRNHPSFEIKEFRINKPLGISQNNTNPLIFSIGPALTMSLASLGSGGISGYNAYMQGRELVEVLPMMVLPIVMIISVLIWNPLQRRFEKKKYLRLKAQRKNDFIKYIDDLKNNILSINEEYRNYLNNNYYLPDELNDLKLLWQKNSQESDYLHLCLGISNLHSKVIIRDDHDFDDDLKETVLKLKSEVKMINDCKLIFNLFEYKYLAVVFNKYDEDLYFNYLMAQIMTYYPYDELKIALVCDETYLYNNARLSALPHFYDNDFSVRYIACNHSEVSKLNRIIDDHTICFVVNESLYKYMDNKKGYAILKCNDLSKVPSYVNAYIKMDGFNGELHLKNKGIINFKINELALFNKKEVFNGLNSCLLSNHIKSDNYDVLSLFDIYKTDVDSIVKRWHENHNAKSLKVILGKFKHEDFYLDLHENGNGPHGLIAGMTGSGKSELIITLIITLCLSYSVNDLNIVIIDFKGGGIIQNFQNDKYVLPHLIGAISNLDDNLLRKSITSLRLECLKRQRLFKQMSDLFAVPNMNIDIYKALYEEHSGLERLANLLIIVDEFAELRKQEPEFLDELISIARIGRSLGIHLILSTQKPSGVVDNQIWSNCRFKICLKVQDKQDSYEMIKVNDASNLKSLGRFYLLCDDVLKEAQCAYSNAALRTKNDKVQILDNLKDVIKETKNKSNPYESELSHAIKNIIKANKHKASGLWLDNIEDYVIENEEGKIVIGVADDYFNKRFLKLTYTNESIVVYSLDSEEKIKFIKAYLFQLVKTSFDREIYIIDGLRSKLDIFKGFCNVADILTLKDEEKINNLFKRCRDAMNEDIKNKITVIITHLPLFKEAYEEHLNKLRNIIQDGKDYGINVILMTTTFNTLHFQEHILLSNKISLFNANFNEVSAIFDLNTKQTITKKGYGLIKLNNLLEFKMNTIDDRLIEEELKNHHGKEKTYILPYIDKNLKIDNDYSIGKDMDNYEWVNISASGLIVTGMIDDLIYRLLYRIKKDNIETVNFNDLGQLFKKPINKPILWIGPGYLKQYHLPIKQKDDLKDREAIYYFNGKIRKLYIAL